MPRSRSWSERSRARRRSSSCSRRRAAARGAAARRSRARFLRRRACRSRTSPSSCSASDARAAAVRAPARRADEPRLDDEARHHVRRARAARAGLPLAHRGLPRRASWSDGTLHGRPDPARARRPQDHDRAVAGVHGRPARAGPRADRGRPRARPQLLRADRARSRGVRRRAAAALQRRARRAARQFQGGALRASCPTPAGDAVDGAVEPPLPQVALGAAPALVDGDCGDWRRALVGVVRQRAATPRRRRSPDATRAPAASATGTSRCSTTPPTSTACSRPTSPRPAARSAAPCARAGRRRRAPFAVLESAPLYDVVRDVNKLSNNVMARQLFLTLATSARPGRRRRWRRPPTPCSRWLAQAQARASRARPWRTARACRATSASRAGGLARLLAAADAQPGARGIRELARGRRDRRHAASGACATAPPRAGRCSRPARSKACGPSRAT